MSCLAEQAKILVAEAEENNLPPHGKWARWSSCNLCKQDYHGVVLCALGWACWKTYASQPVDYDSIFSCALQAMKTLGDGLGKRPAEALSAYQALLQIGRLPLTHKLIIQGNIVAMYERLGRTDESLAKMREVYVSSRLLKPSARTILTARNMAVKLLHLGDARSVAEARSIIRETFSLAQNLLGNDHQHTFMCGDLLCACIVADERASRDEQVEAVVMTEDLLTRSRRIFGDPHPITQKLKSNLKLFSDRLTTRAQK